MKCSLQVRCEAGFFQEQYVLGHCCRLYSWPCDPRLTFRQGGRERKKKEREKENGGRGEKELLPARPREERRREKLKSQQASWEGRRARARRAQLCTLALPPPETPTNRLQTRLYRKKGGAWLARQCLEVLSLLAHSLDRRAHERRTDLSLSLSLSSRVLLLLLLLQSLLLPLLPPLLSVPYPGGRFPLPSVLSPWATKRRKPRLSACAPSFSLHFSLSLFSGLSGQSLRSL